MWKTIMLALVLQVRLIMMYLIAFLWKVLSLYYVFMCTKVHEKRRNRKRLHNYTLQFKSELICWCPKNWISETLLNTYMHTCMHACIHPSIQPASQPASQPCMHASRQTDTHTHIHTYIHTDDTKKDPIIGKKSRQKFAEIAIQEKYLLKI